MGGKLNTDLKEFLQEDFIINEVLNYDEIILQRGEGVALLHYNDELVTERDLAGRLAFLSAPANELLGNIDSFKEPGHYHFYSNNPQISYRLSSKPNGLYFDYCKKYSGELLEGFDNELRLGFTKEELLEFDNPGDFFAENQKANNLLGIKLINNKGKCLKIMNPASDLFTSVHFLIKGSYTSIREQILEVEDTIGLETLVEENYDTAKGVLAASAIEMLHAFIISQSVTPLLYNRTNSQYAEKMALHFSNLNERILDDKFSNDLMREFGFEAVTDYIGFIFDTLLNSLEKYLKASRSVNLLK